MIWNVISFHPYVYLWIWDVFYGEMTRKYHTITILDTILNIIQVKQYRNGTLSVPGFPWLPSRYNSANVLNMVYLNLGINNCCSQLYINSST